MTQPDRPNADDNNPQPKQPLCFGLPALGGWSKQPTPHSCK